MANINPYEPPAIKQVLPAEVQADATKATTATLIAWPLVLASNLVVPFLLGSSMIREHGKVGVLAGVLLFAVAGWALIVRRPKQGSRLVVGAAILIATQFLPITQIIAGSIAFRIAKLLGQAQIGDGEGLDDRITSEWGGFIVTSVTGSILACMAFVLGAIVLAAMKGFRNRSSPSFTLDS